MVCLEFDLKEFPLGNLKAPQNKSDGNQAQKKFNRKFRVIDQDFIESKFTFRLNGNCHGQKIFNQNEPSLGFSFSGKKVIKSI